MDSSRFKYSRSLLDSEIDVRGGEKSERAEHSELERGPKVKVTIVAFLMGMLKLEDRLSMRMGCS